MNAGTNWSEVLAPSDIDDEDGQRSRTIQTPGWLRVDEREDLINALEHSVEIAFTVRSEPRNWKWLLIVAHSAIQGALVCTLTGTDGTGALTEKSIAEWQKWHRRRREGADAAPPKDRLASLLQLYGRAKQKEFMSEFGGSPISTTEGQDADVGKLNLLRGEFVHFKSRIWSVEIEGLPRIVLNTVAIVEQLMKHPSLSLRLDRGQSMRAGEAITKLRQLLS